MKQEILEPLVRAIVKNSFKPAVTVSIRDIIRAVKEETGQEPSTSEVRRAMGKAGLVNEKKYGHNWVYKHRKDHE